MIYLTEEFESYGCYIEGDMRWTVEFAATVTKDKDRNLIRVELFDYEEEVVEFTGEWGEPSGSSETVSPGKYPLVVLFYEERFMDLLVEEKDALLSKVFNSYIGDYRIVPYEESTKEVM
ncbi:MAG: hypothetical protein ACRCUJ_02915 [Phocaeicola sp.]